MLAHEGYHAKVITVPFQSASSVLIPAGICSVIAGCFKIWATRITDASPPRVRKRSLRVSLSTNEQLFKYMYSVPLILTCQTQLFCYILNYHTVLVYLIFNLFQSVGNTHIIYTLSCQF